MDGNDIETFTMRTVAIIVAVITTIVIFLVVVAIVE
jgi:hypothetical protein